MTPPNININIAHQPANYSRSRTPSYNKPRKSPTYGANKPHPGGRPTTGLPGSAPAFTPPPAPMDPTAPGAPGAATYGATTADVQRRYGDATSALGQQEYQTKQQYGLEPGFDTNNPFSQASRMKLQFEQGQRGRTNSLAAQGMLYDGALSNSLDSGRVGYAQNQDAMQKSYASALQAISQRRLAAERDREGGLEQARATATEAALKQEPDASQFMGDGGSPGKGPRTQYGKPKFSPPKKNNPPKKHR